MKFQFKKRLAVNRGFFLFILTGFFSLNVIAKPMMSDTETEASIVNNTMQTWMKKQGIPGAAVQVYSQGIPHAYYFGVESLKTGKPVTENTIFEVGSWTKVLTCLLAAEEANAGKLKLTDAVTQYLPYLGEYPNTPFKSITLLNLGTHTAGLPFSVSDDIKSPKELPHYLAHWQPSAPVGTHWAYSNVSIGLLGDAIAAETHENINDLYIHQLFQPLGMSSTGFYVSKAHQADYAQSYDINGQPVPHLPLRLFPAAGAVKMSARDAGLFLKAALNMPGTPTKIAEAMKTTQTPYARTADFEQGLGWVIYPITYPISQKTRENLLNPSTDMDMGPLPSKPVAKNEQNFNGSFLMDKTGATNGFRAYIVVIPNKKSGVVILTNRYVSNAEIIKTGREILLNLDKEVIY